MFRKCFLFQFVLLSWMTTVSYADVRVTSIFSDHMVLQQNQKLRLWGWADADEKVTVTIGSQQQSASPDKSGRWEVVLPPMPASKTPTTISIRGKNLIEVKDVLVGEVWLCSGQSNMEWSVAACTNAGDEIANAKHPTIRHFKVPLKQSNLPVEDVQSQWQICSPETAGSFTACGYFMARHLQKELDVPIGLVNSSWGGTRVEPWTPPIGFQKYQLFKESSNRSLAVRRVPKTIKIDSINTSRPSMNGRKSPKRN